jgi:methionyl-tRNA formyltransferase
MRYRVVFMGTPQFAVPTLRALLAGPDEVAAVVSQPDRPGGRGRHPQPPPVKQLAVECGLPVLQPASAHDSGFLAHVRALQPDLIVLTAFGQILADPLLRLPRLGCLNVHASLLPKYRGAAPIQWAVLNGDLSSGVSVIQMNPRLDAGDLLLSRRLPIREDETALDLGRRLAAAGAHLLMEVLRRQEYGLLHPVPQNEDEATFAPRLHKKDGLISWADSAAGIARRLRAMHPWPGAYTYWRGRRLKLFQGRPILSPGRGTPGEVLELDASGRLWVQTGDGQLLIAELQLENRPWVSASAFVQGHRDIIGEHLGS